MSYYWLFYFCKYRGVLSLFILCPISIYVCFISIAWILLFFLSACESQKTPQNDHKRSWIYTLQHFDLTYYSLMDLSEKKVYCASYLSLLFLCFVSLSFVFIDKTWNTMISCLCLLTLTIVYTSFLYIEISIEKKMRKEEGLSLPPFSLNRKCAVQILWSRWKRRWEAGNAVWHCTSCWPSAGARRHSVTLWVFLSADSTPQAQQWRWGRLSCVTPTIQTAVELALHCTLIIWAAIGYSLVVGISGKWNEIRDDKSKITMTAGVHWLPWQLCKLNVMKLQRRPSAVYHLLLKLKLQTTQTGHGHDGLRGVSVLCQVLGNESFLVKRRLPIHLVQLSL